MRPLRVVVLVLGCLLALIGLGLLAGGATLGWALATQRDDEGFFTTGEERFASDTYAITSEEIDLGDLDVEEWWTDRDLATVRVVAGAAGSDGLFLGIGPEADVEAYLADVPHDEISDVDFRPFSVEYQRQHDGGTEVPGPPEDEGFWVATGAGESTKTVTWDLEPGRWAIVLMNADASPGVVADVDLGGKLEYLVPIAIGLGVAGVVFLGGGTAMIVGSLVRRRGAIPVTTAAAAPTAGTPGAVAVRVSPVRLEGHLDPGLSRWQWLVKWFLAIPHYVVLVFLWIAFVVTTVVAFFAILFTGRYPRAIFGFNVGVLRWTWRVAFYATNPLGTDRYPPFSLDPADYPATLDITYPERLSRGLVLVKWWLLAIPHLLVVGALTSTWIVADDVRDADSVLAPGLLTILVVIAAVALLFTRRYPRGLFDLVVGLDRWIARVVAYVALMTDEYPPFRLDQGPTEPMPPAADDADTWMPPVVTS